MATTAERLMAAYPQEQRTWVLPCNKASAIELLDRLKRVIVEEDSFEEFPEGNTGVIVYALLKLELEQCPDLGDFGHVLEGFQHITEAAHQVLSDGFSFF